MPVQLNHTIVWCTDKKQSASFLAGILGRPAPRAFLHFLIVDMDNGVSLDFYQQDKKPALQHYAFLIGEAAFDQVIARIKQQKLNHWADPARTQPGQINHHWGGRGVYFEDPDGHLLEVITKPYGDPSGIVQRTTNT
ncbi:MAG: VOC family protein [Alphaproteobacteria bacterium]|nr:VOC family protein [Alphaproteobacteria bacterium]